MLAENCALKWKMVFVDTNTLLAKIKHCVKQSRITVNIFVTLID